MEGKALVVILGLFISSCATGTSLVKKTLLINKGDTKQQVLNTLGMPGDRQFKGDDEAWQYCNTDYVGLDGDKFVLVWFYQGEVTGINTFSNSQIGTCEGFFKSIKWENAPDHTIEVRVR